MIDDGRPPWVPYYPAKLLGALDAMPADQKLVYQIVLLRIYDAGGPLKDPLDAITRRCGINKRRTSDALDALFKAGKLAREGDGIVNAFASEILAETDALRKRRATAGQKGASRRWEKGKEKQSTPHGKPNAKALADDSQLHLQIQEAPSPGGDGASARVPRKTFLPADWTPDAEDLAYAENQGFDRAEALNVIAPAFKDHHRARGNRMVNWHAAWRTWVRHEVAFRARRRGVAATQNGGSRDGRPDRSTTTAADRLVEGIREGSLSIPGEPKAPSSMLAKGEASPRLLPPERRERS